MNFLKKLFEKSFAKDGISLAEINKLFAYLAEETDSIETVEKYSSQYHRAKRRYKKKGDQVFINIYLEWEDFLVAYKQTTKESFRAKVAARVEISKFSIDLRLIFLDHRKKTIYLYEHFVSHLVDYIINNLGFETFKKTIQQLPADSIFKELEVKSDGVSFDTLNRKIVDDIVNYPLDLITRNFKSFVTLIYYSIELAIGQKVTHGLLNEMFRELQETYNSEIASIILKIAPEKVLDFDKWLTVLSKSELEKQVREKTIELEKLNDTLEEKVRERTIELEKAYEDLKEVDRKKSEFISVAAHQLRTPLSGIKWTMSLLMDEEIGPLNKEQKEFIKKTFDTNEAVIEIVNAMLNTDELSRGKAAYNFTRESLSEIFDEIIKELLPQAKAKKIQISNSAKDDTKIEVDKTKIKMALENIIDNAVKYSKDGDIISIETENINNTSQILIKDTGIGIPKKQEEEIFERFFRAENAKRVATAGSGLGLFITKNIIEDHGGRIWFESKENKGTTFHISLPMKQENSS